MTNLRVHKQINKQKNQTFAFYRATLRREDKNASEFFQNHLLSNFCFKNTSNKSIIKNI